MEKLVFKMVDDMQEVGASEGHACFNNILRTKGITAVLGVYNQQKPAHMVIEELLDWAVKNDKPEIVDLIEELQQDMSWNEGNPILEEEL
ncbi:hypothetical protein HWB07_gp129 [Bacillus phage vB_BsuM-Goe3]|uniref:Uncharacterized protein n=1 Tax=Bacillus phage vB_BsuM-Goe3 TaxID=1933063 RepID=A0A217ERB4_BPGO3|nr:hypothetical protein HWB07_gp129 [Bacillus phage vB_BsuM-Goe3]APZ82641.1 hypothetical protein Goe3_c18000 [Bacillus phage vB_BsuM-Goe3]